MLVNEEWSRNDSLHTESRKATSGNDLEGILLWLLYWCANDSESQSKYKGKPVELHFEIC
jgi:hypothetical protein